MTLEELNWLSTAASLTWIAKQLSLIDPVDPLYRICVFCHMVMGFSAPLIAHTEQCAWRVAKELFSGQNGHETHLGTDQAQVTLE